MVICLIDTGFKSTALTSSFRELHMQASHRCWILIEARSNIHLASIPLASQNQRMQLKHCKRPCSHSSTRTPERCSSTPPHDAAGSVNLWMPVCHLSVFHHDANSTRANALIFAGLLWDADHQNIPSAHCFPTRVPMSSFERDLCSGFATHASSNACHISVQHLCAV